MPIQVNPHNIQPPDFNHEDFLESRERIVDRFHLSQAEAAQHLLDLWQDDNRIKRRDWDHQQAQLAQQRHIDEQQAREEREEAQRQQQQEQDDARKEDRKKNRAKFLPYANVPPPSSDECNPSPLALRKLQKGEFVELYFFTNKGLADAQDFNHSVDDDAFALMPNEEGLHSFIPIAAAKAKQAIIQDKDLTWDQIDQAVHRLLAAMKRASWPAERVQDILKFFLNLATHSWRHDPDETAQQALIAYQAVYRRRWHDSLGTDSSFNLKFIDQEALTRLKAKIVDQRRLAIDLRAKEAADRLEMAANRASSSFAPPHTTSNVTSQYGNRDRDAPYKPSSTKRPLSPNADPNSSRSLHKRQKSLRGSDKGTPNSEPLPPCAVCLSIEPHDSPVVECAKERTWDGKFEVFAKRVFKSLVARLTNQRLCTRWQRREGCNEKHTPAHICSGCGSATHGACLCPRRQKHQGANAV